MQLEISMVFGIVFWLSLPTFAPVIANDEGKIVGELRRFDGHTDKVSSVALSPDGKTALSSSDDRTVRQWDLESGKMLRVFAGHEDYALSVAFLPDGGTAFSGGGGLWDPTKRFYFPGTDHALRLWDMESGKVLRRFEGHTAPVWSVALSADGSPIKNRSSKKGHSTFCPSKAYFQCAIGKPSFLVYGI